MIGQNNGDRNTAAEIADGVIAIVDLLEKKLPGTKILLLAIFQRRPTPTPEREILSGANIIFSQHFKSDPAVTFLDINSVFVQPDGSIPASLMPDFEHPSALGFEKWAEAIEPKVAELMGEAQKPPPHSLPGKPAAYVATSAEVRTEGILGGRVGGGSAAAAPSPKNIRMEPDGLESERVNFHWLLLSVVTGLGITFYAVVMRILSTEQSDRIHNYSLRNISNAGRSATTTA
jgi:hypothetical protein